jgi:hypothetical protein
MIVTFEFFHLDLIVVVVILISFIISLLGVII